jgi:hypothetical protein
MISAAVRRTFYIQNISPADILFGTTPDYCTLLPDNMVHPVTARLLVTAFIKE